MGVRESTRAPRLLGTPGSREPLIHLDTSFLIRALVHGTPEDRALRSWIRAGTPLAMCAVGWAEFLCGPLEESHLELVRRFVNEIVPFGSEAATKAALLFNRTGRRRGSLADCMIAATAIAAGAMLATSNRDDFEYPSTEHWEFCCGIQYHRVEKEKLLYASSLWLARKLLGMEQAKPGSKYVDDESAMNQMMYEMKYSPGVLPIDLFPTGRNSWSLDPIVVHANWAVGIGTKEHRLREGGHWYVDEMLKELGI